MPDPFEQALTALRDAYTHISDLIAKMPAGQAAFEAAGQLASILRDLNGAVAVLRADQAHRIYEAEELSLAGLADRIGVSKARAQQIIDTAKKGPQP